MESPSVNAQSSSSNPFSQNTPAATTAAPQVDPATPVAQTSAEPPLKSKSKKKWLVVIILILCLLVAVCIGFFSFIFSWVLGTTSESYAEAVDDVLLDVCNSHGNFAMTEYETWFTSDMTYTEAFTETEVLFPQDYGCDSLDVSGFVDIVLSGKSLSVNNTNGLEILGVTFDENGKTIELVRRNGNWRIQDIN